MRTNVIAFPRKEYVTKNEFMQIAGMNHHKQNEFIKKHGIKTIWVEGDSRKRLAYPRNEAIKLLRLTGFHDCVVAGKKAMARYVVTI